MNDIEKRSFFKFSTLIQLQVAESKRESICREHERCSAESLLFASHKTSDTSSLPLADASSYDLLSTSSSLVEERLPSLAPLHNGKNKKWIIWHTPVMQRICGKGVSLTSCVHMALQLGIKLTTSFMCHLIFNMILSPSPRDASFFFLSPLSPLSPSAH